MEMAEEESWLKPQATENLNWVPRAGALVAASRVHWQGQPPGEWAIRRDEDGAFILALTEQAEELLIGRDVISYFKTRRIESLIELADRIEASTFKRVYEELHRLGYETRLSLARIHDQAFAAVQKYLESDNKESARFPLVHALTRLNDRRNELLGRRNEEHQT